MNKQTKSILWILTALSLAICGMIGFFRVQKEERDKQFQIAIRYGDVLNIAQQTDKSVEEVLGYFKSQGVTTLFVRENTVAPISKGEFYNFKEQGKANYYDGYELQKRYPDATQIKLQLTYIEAFDEESFQTIYDNYEAKHIQVRKLEIEGTAFIEIKAPSSVLTTIGVGFNEDDLRIASDLGYIISLQLKTWNNVTDEGISQVLDDLRDIENLGPIYLADSNVKEFIDTPLVPILEEKGLGFVEFFSEKQVGYSALAKKASNNETQFDVVRLHTLTDAEVLKYDTTSLVDRYMLALTERNNRVFLFKMPNTYDIEADVTFITDNIQSFKEEAETEGFTIGSIDAKYNLKKINFILTAFAGVGAGIIFLLICDFVGFTTLGYCLSLLGLIGYVTLLKISPLLAIRMMALFGAIVFPTYAVLIALNTVCKTVGQVLLNFLRTCLISFGGALTIVGCLSRTSFGLGIDVFSGVKLAHIAPLVLVVGILLYKTYGIDIQKIKRLANTPITYLIVCIGLLGMIVLYIYTSRTGNGGSVSNLELAFRQFLDTTLGVRPRNKEFLIGHPMLIILLYYYQRKGQKLAPIVYFPLVILGMIGQISLVNTYAHIHTPILISLRRTGYGIMIGTIVGLFALWVIRLIDKGLKKWVDVKR